MVYWSIKDGCLMSIKILKTGWAMMILSVYKNMWELLPKEKTWIGEFLIREATFMMSKDLRLIISILMIWGRLLGTLIKKVFHLALLS